MTGLDTSQPITDDAVLREGHAHAEEKAAKSKEAVDEKAAQPRN